MFKKLLEVKNLKTYFNTREGISRAVDGVDFEIYTRETLGIVGESGCGKSVTALSIMRLIPSITGRIVDGEILFNGQNLLKLDQQKIESIRGNDISMIFQEPMTSLNPIMTIGKQISEAIMCHKRVSQKDAMNESLVMLKKVGIPIPEQRLNEYPFQLSGGMRQRVMIAIALACNPKLLIADEPTTALDVSIQAQILELINNLKKEYGMSIMIITHDLGVIAEICDRVAVMYGGKIMEYTKVNTIFDKPLHPYTLGLLNSIPKLDQKIDRLKTIPGNVPCSLNITNGCKFHTRCHFANEKCRNEEPKIKEVGKDHKVRCWHYQKLYQQME